MFDILFNDYIEFEKYFDNMLKILDFVTPFHSEALPETNNDANSIKHHEEKLNKLQNENKQLKDDKRTLPEIIRLNENKCMPGSKSSTDDDADKWEIVKSRKNKRNKNNRDRESVSVMNKFQPLFIHQKELSAEHNMQ